MKMKKNLIDYELLWEKITDYVKATSRTTARPVLLLYYVLRSPETPSSDKMLIVAALSYLVLPIDLISAKRLPIIGWVDEAGSLVYAFKKGGRFVDKAVILWYAVTGGVSRPSGAVPTNAGGYLLCWRTDARFHCGTTQNDPGGGSIRLSSTSRSFNEGG